jgi:hypothetical protein
MNTAILIILKIRRDPPARSPLEGSTPPLTQGVPIPIDVMCQQATFE